MTTEGVGDRIARLLAANVHALIGSLDNAARGPVLDPYLREFDEVIFKASQDLGHHETTRRQTAQAIARTKRDMETLDAQLAATRRHLDEAAARASTARRIDLENQLGTLDVRLSDAAQRCAEIESDLLALRAKCDQMAQVVAAATASSLLSHPATDLGANACTVQDEQLGQGSHDAMAATGAADLGTADAGADAALLRRLEVIQKEQRISERLKRLQAASSRDAA